MNKRRCRNKPCSRYFRPKPGSPSWEVWCSDPCREEIAIAVLQKQRESRERSARKAAERERKEARKQKKRFKDNDYRHQVRLTQQSFNELVRLLDQGQPCICCDRPTVGKSVDCGHFLSRGSHPELRFCFLNAWLQLTSCNRGSERYGAHKSTTRQGFERGITERAGADALEWLKGPHELVKHTCDEMRQMRAMYRAESRYIKQYGRPSRNWRAFPSKEAAA